jgi:hypothetical protein
MATTCSPKPPATFARFREGHRDSSTAEKKTPVPTTPALIFCGCFAGTLRRRPSFLRPDERRTVCRISNILHRSS